MKKILLHTMMALGISSFPFLFLHAAASVSSPVVFSLVPPAASLEIDDLDVRDELNRPVRSEQSRRRFVSLWNAGLTQLFLSSLTPTKLRTLELLRTAGLAAKEFFTHVLFRLGRTVEALVPTARFLSMGRWRVAIGFSSPTTLSAVGATGFLNDFLACVLASTRILR